MPRMIELIRASAVPSNIVQSAALGSLAMPAGEMIEILVYLALHNDVFRERARLTLAGWDEKSSQAMATDPHAPKEVLEYFISPNNIRLALLPALLDNLSVPEVAVAELASIASREAVDVMLKSARVNLSPRILNALASNPNLSGIQAETVKAKIAPEPDPAAEKEEVLAGTPTDPADTDDVLDEDFAAYLAEHADEIAAEEDKPFQPIGGSHEDILSMDEPLAESAVAGDAETRHAVSKKTSLTADESRGSALQKISKLDVKGRIQLAIKGSKEERSILVRDGTKVVALAVLESPKVTDSEVERFAAQKNVLETLLRGISMKRRFMKSYPVVRNLVSNPRTPLDVSITLIKNVMVNDLKTLAANKDVSDTVRKVAIKMFKQKNSGGGRK